LHNLRRHSATITDLAQSPKARLGIQPLSPPWGLTAPSSWPHRRATTASQRQIPRVQQGVFSGSTAAFGHIEACTPKVMPSRGCWHGTRHSTVWWWWLKAVSAVGLARQVPAPVLQKLQHYSNAVKPRGETAIAVRQHLKNWTANSPSHPIMPLLIELQLFKRISAAMQPCSLRT